MILKISKPLTLAYATNATTITGTVKVNGVFKGATIVVPDLDGSHTVTASILDADGGTIWSKAALAESATTSVYVDANNAYFSQPLHGTVTLSLVTSGSQTANRSFTFHVYYER